MLTGCLQWKERGLDRNTLRVSRSQTLLQCVWFVSLCVPGPLWHRSLKSHPGLAIVNPTPSSISWEPLVPGAAVEAQTLQALGERTLKEAGFGWSGAVRY